MMRVQNHKYDPDNDVLHVFFPPYALSVDDEEYPGFIIKYSVDDERITGLVILDFSKRSERELRNIFPRYDLVSLQKEIVKN